MSNNNGVKMINAGHIIIIVTTLVAIGISWGAFSQKITTLESLIHEKADRQIVEIQLQHINEKLDRIEKKLGK